MSSCFSFGVLASARFGTFRASAFMAAFSHQACEIVTSTASTVPYCYSYVVPPLSFYLTTYSYSLPCFTVTTVGQRPVFFYFMNDASIFFPGLGQSQQLVNSPSLVPKKVIMVGEMETKIQSCVRAQEAGREKRVWKAKSVSVGEGKSSPEPKLADRRFQPVELECLKTTVMIKNIPNKFTETLMEVLDEHCKRENQKALISGATDTEKGEGLLSSYDFVYLPIDFRSKSNKGYAFVNFTEPTSAWKFHLSLNNHKWRVHNSRKICEITYARIQGKDALIKHFRDTVFACETDEFLPLYFEPSRDGSGDSVAQCVVGKRVSSYGGN